MDIHKYMETFRYGHSPSADAIVKYEYYDFERDMINHIVDNRFSLIKKNRQMHMTNLLSHYVAWRLLTAYEYDPITIVYVSNSLSMSSRFLGMVYDNIRRFFNMSGVKSDFFIIQNNKEMKLKNGNRLRGVSCTLDALRGFRPDELIIDEAAFIENGATVFGAALTALGTGGKAILASTPNGMDALYYKTIDLSIKGEIDFKLLSKNWRDNPLKDSEWFDNMCQNMNHDELRIKQELFGQIIFNASGLVDLDVTNKVFYQPIVTKTHTDNGKIEYKTFYSMDIMADAPQSGEMFDHYSRLINSLKHE